MKIFILRTWPNEEGARFNSADTMTESYFASVEDLMKYIQERGENSLTDCGKLSYVNTEKKYRDGQLHEYTMCGASFNPIFYRLYIEDNDRDKFGRRISHYIGE